MITDIKLFKKIYENVMADKNYTHFAIFKSTNQIMDGWNYSDIETDDLNSDKNFYFYNDLKDNFPEEKINSTTVKLVTRKFLDRNNIDPENIDNWYRPTYNSNVNESSDLLNKYMENH